MPRGAGILRGYGAPQFRVTAGLTYEAPIHTPKPKAELPPIVRKTIVLRGVNFHTARHDLTPAARRTLSENVAMLQDEPALKVRIEGHTDHRGSVEYNQALSERRAESVRAFFIANGIQAGRLQVWAFGETQPEVPNTSAHNMWLNRRVVVQILEYPSAKP
ncbi:MAG: OmpA family protein [Deltaproteobacteria bacterium]|nr:OmpA family protein [Deltaproteobacteria bacterium]